MAKRKTSKKTSSEPDGTEDTETQPDKETAADASEAESDEQSQEQWGAMMNIDFLGEIDNQPASIVVELAHSIQVASARHGSDTKSKLAELAGSDPIPVFKTPKRSSGFQTGVTVASFDNGKPDFGAERFLEFEVKDAGAAHELAAKIASEKMDEVAEVLPAPLAIPAICPLPHLTPDAKAAGPVPNFLNRMGYLGPGPDGFGFVEAWHHQGGDGTGVTIIDIEGSWLMAHDELAASRMNLWSGVNIDSEAWGNHGLAVASMLTASHDGLGTASICPGARVGMVSVFSPGDPPRQSIANQINEAGALLSAGDVLLLELQRPGPRTDYQPNEDQEGYIPLTFWPDVSAVVRSLSGRGIVVVSVAGNGGENLDDEIYQGRFDLDKHDSGCILVGAGTPPFGGVGRARERMSFSNYGSAVDCQAWGNLVTTAGYGDLWGDREDGTDHYTAQFMGTSSAAPLIAGVIACIQGRHKAVYGTPVNPLYLRELLRSTGWRPDIQVDGEPAFVPQPDVFQLMQILDLL